MFLLGRSRKERIRGGGGSAIGIDLGTTNSCVGVLRNGRVEIIANEHSNRITPSWVSFKDSDRYIGDGAANQASTNLSNTVFDAKRLIGRRFDEPIVQADLREWPFTVIPGANRQPLIAVYHNGERKCFTPEEISAMVLWKMKTIAETFLGDTVSKAVVTVPAHFTDSQRQATKHAAAIAGLEVLRILNEPTAAAMAYAVENKDRFQGVKKRFLVFDLGGGTFDVSIVDFDGRGPMKVIATSGDTHLGGQDFDNRMVTDLVDLFAKRHKNDIRIPQGHNIEDNQKSRRKLKEACEKAKKTLSCNPIAEIYIESLFENIDFNHRIPRAKFEDLNRPLFDRCMDILQRLLEDKNISRESISEIVLVGGSSRIPRIQERLKSFFPGKELRYSINPDEAVAYGATVFAAILNKEWKVPKGLMHDGLHDITPLSLGIEIAGGEVKMVVPRNTPIPCEVREEFSNPDYEKGVRISVYEGEGRAVRENHFLGQFELGGLEPKPAGSIKIPVTFEIDADGILTVSAKVQSSTAKSVQMRFDKGRLSEEEVDRMRKEMEAWVRQEEEKRRLSDAKEELQRIISCIKDAAGNPIVREHRDLQIATTNEQTWLQDESSDATLPEVHRRKVELERLWIPVKAKLRT